MPAIDRHLRPRVLEAVADTRVVVVQGARQVGKTTLVRTVVDDLKGRLVTLDDDLTRNAARADPVGFLDQQPDGLMAIDEVQRIPELMLALKLLVDRDPRPGRFLLTGSADLLRLPATEDSLAGRAESIELHGFSQGELAGIANSSSTDSSAATGSSARQDRSIGPATWNALWRVVTRKPCPVRPGGDAVGGWTTT